MLITEMKNLNNKDYMTKQKQHITKNGAQSVNFNHKPLFTLTKREIERIEDTYWVRYNK